VLGCIVVLFSTVFTFYSILRNPLVQTIGARMASDYLSEKLHTTVRISGFNLSLTRGLTLDDLLVKDLKGANLIAAHRISVVPGRISLSRKILRVRKVYIDRGEFQLITHKGDTTLNLQFLIDYFSSSDTTKAPEKKKPGKPWKIDVSMTELIDFHFHFQDENKPAVPVGMDYANIDVSHINLVMSDFRPEGDTMNAIIRHLSARERSGFNIRAMSGEFHVSPAFLKAHKMRLVTDHCNLDLTFDFLYHRWNDYTDFLNKVRIVADIHPSWFDLQDIGPYAPVMYQMKNRFHISGVVDGTVNNFRAVDFSIGFGKSTRLLCNIHSNGLPDVMNTFADLHILALETNHDDVAGLKLPIEGSSIPLPALLSNAGMISVAGYYTGFWNDFIAQLNIRTDIGNINTNLTLKKDKENKTMLYSGELDVADLDINQLVRTSRLTGPVTFRADLRGKGFTFKDADLLMNVWVDSIQLNRYMYQHLHLKGSLADRKFDGNLHINDPNLRMDFNGTVDLGDTIPSYRFLADIRHADLYALNLVKRNPVTDLATHLDVNFRAKNVDDIDGEILIRDTRYQEGDKVLTMDEFHLLTSKDPGGKKTYQLTSDYLDADFKGTFNFREMVPSLATLINNYLVSFKLSDSLMSHHSAFNQVFTYRIFLKDTREVTEMFLPFLELHSGSFIQGYYDEGKGLIRVNGYSPVLHIFGMDLDEWYLHADSRVDDLNIKTGCQTFRVEKRSEQDSILLAFDSVELYSDLRNDSILYRLEFLNGTDTSRIGGYINFGMNPAMKIRIDRFDLYADNKYWKISPDNWVTIDSSRIDIHDLAFSTTGHVLRFNGIISRDPADTLEAYFDHLDISDADHLIGDSSVDVDGIMSGTIRLSNVYRGLSVISDLRIDQFKFNKELLGDARIIVGYNESTDKFDVRTDIIYTGNIGTNIPFSLEGSFSLAQKDPTLDFTLKLKNLNLKMINPFVSGFMSGLRGMASGEFTIRGTFRKPVMKGELQLMRTELKLNYLNVPYSLADPVLVDSNGFHFNNITIYDSLGHKAFLNGSITHHYFRNIALDLSIDYTDFSAFRNTYAQNNIFYGNARATGTVRITGPPDNLSITVKASTTGGTHVVIPINTTADISQNDYILFENPGQDTLNRGPRVPRVLTGGLSLNVALLVKPSADLEVFFPDQLGNIRANGTGNITMGLTPTSDFTMTGSYTLQKGSFLFALKNLLRLNFVIREGSKITWSGDPTDATISLSAAYKTRVPLAGLTADASKSSTRVPVECILHLQGKLLNPDISFSLSMPNVDEDVKTLVYGAIDTTNVSEMNEQMIYILVMNQFKPVTGSAFDQFDVSGTSLSLLTNQVSSWLSSVSKNVNVGVNYKPGYQNTGQEFDVALSTQLLNDRLLIDGLFGMQSSTTSTTTGTKANTIVGDINIQYFLTKNRRYSIRAFNRTNTVDLLNNNSPYTQGVGISYQRDFTNWKELFQRENKNK